MFNKQKGSNYFLPNFYMTKVVFVEKLKKSNQSYSSSYTIINQPLNHDMQSQEDYSIDNFFLLSRSLDDDDSSPLEFPRSYKSVSTQV